MYSSAGGSAFQQCSSVPIRVVDLLQTALRELRAVFLKHPPHLDPRRAVQPRPASDSRHAPILLFGRHTVGKNDPLPFVAVEGVPVVEILGFLVECQLPRLLMAPVDDARLVATTPQEADHPAVQVCHLDARHLVRRADGPQVVLDVSGQVSGEGREQDAAAVRTLTGEPPRPVHRDHGLARTCPAENPHRSVPVPFDEPALRRMQEDPPALQGRVQHRLQFHFVVHDDEPGLGIGPVQRLLEIGGVDRLADGLALQHKPLVGLASQVQEERLVRFNRQPRLHGVEFHVVAHRAHLLQHGGRNAETRQLAIAQVLEGRRSVGRGRRGILALRPEVSRNSRLGLVDLERSRLGVDPAFVPLGPGVRVVMLGGPQQHVDVAAVRLEHDGPIAAVDAQRPHVPVPCPVGSARSSVRWPSSRR